MTNPLLKFRFANQKIVDKKLAVSILLIFLATCLYVLNIKIFFVPISIIGMSLCFPYPKIFKSFFSKLLVSTLLFYSLIQLFGAFQFMFAPELHFKSVAVVLGFTLIVLSFVLSPTLKDKVPFVLVNTRDIAGLCASICFTLPLLVFLFGGNSLLHIAEIGSSQSHDELNHRYAIQQLTLSQHLQYSNGYYIPHQGAASGYYPMGYHLGAAFIESSFGTSQIAHSWSYNARAFFAEDIVFAVMLGYFLAYLAYYCLDMLGGIFGKKTTSFIISFTIAPTLGLVYLFLFLRQGFANYYYVSAVIFCALIFTHEFYSENFLKVRGKLRNYNLVGVFNLRSIWLLTAYLLLIFGVSMSWPLLLPPLLLIPAFYILSDIRNIKYFKNFFRLSYIPILFAFLIQLIPIYFQLKYSSISGQQGIFSKGGITVFDFGPIIMGAIILLIAFVSKDITGNAKKFLVNIFMPFYLFLALVIGAQYFYNGIITYYAIKTGYLIEMMILAFVAAWLTFMMVKNIGRIRSLLVVPTLVSLTFLLLIAISGSNPLLDVRALFTNYDNYGQSTGFDQDVDLYIKLSNNGQVANSNTTILHHDPISGFLSGDLQISDWFNDVNKAHNTSTLKLTPNNCSGLYGTEMYTLPSPEQQQAIVSEINNCIKNAQITHNKYYILTNASSIKYLQSVFNANNVVFVAE